MPDHRPRLPAPTPVVRPMPDGGVPEGEIIQALSHPLEECLKALRRANFAIILGLLIGIVAVCAAWPHGAAWADKILRSARGEPAETPAPVFLWPGCHLEQDGTIRCPVQKETPP